MKKKLLKRFFALTAVLAVLAGSAIAFTRLTSRPPVHGNPFHPYQPS